MAGIRVVIAAVVSAMAFLCTLSIPSIAVQEEPFLDFTEDNFKVAFISGNFTAAMTYDWPRVIFHHSTDLLAPSYEVGFPLFYLFNDTNGDGLFEKSEAIYYARLDTHHNASWTPSPVAFGNLSDGSEYAQFRMNGSISLFLGEEESIPFMEHWANATFYFTVTENATRRSNFHGIYSVEGKTAMSVNFTLDINEHVNVTGIALEHFLKGGAGTYMFLLRESSLPDAPLTAVSSRVDETLNGPDFTHRFNQTDWPYQEVDFAKENLTVQAFYNYDSDPNSTIDGNTSSVAVNASYYSTGDGLILHTSYPFSNQTDSLTHFSYLGIDESGFYRRVHDWFTRNLTLILIVMGSVIGAGVVAGILFLGMRQEWLYRKDPDSKKGNKKP